jgi:hypothetical protein
VVLHQLLLAANATTVVTGQVVLAHLLRIEILRMQLILLRSQKLEQQLLLTWNVPDPDGAGPCTAATDQMNITINNATVANAGPDQTSCGASSITLAANATTVVTGQVVLAHLLRIEILLNATYTPAVVEIGTTITLTWNVPDPDGSRSLYCCN